MGVASSGLEEWERGQSREEGEGTPRQSTGGRTDLPPWWSQDPDRSLDPSSCQPVVAITGNIQIVQKYGQFLQTELFLQVVEL